MLHVQICAQVNRDFNAHSFLSHCNKANKKEIEPKETKSTLKTTSTKAYRLGFEPCAFSSQVELATSRLNLLYTMTALR